MKPSSITGEWEIVARYDVHEGHRRVNRDVRENERIQITNKALLVFKPGAKAPDEAFEFKTVRLAGDGIGLVEMSDKQNGMNAMNILYRFQGDHLQFCINEALDGKPARFGAKGTMIIELMPYQQDRIVSTHRPLLPETKEPKAVGPQPQPAKK